MGSVRQSCKRFAAQKKDFLWKKKKVGRNWNSPWEEDVSQERNRRAKRTKGQSSVLLLSRKGKVGAVETRGISRGEQGNQRPLPRKEKEKALFRELVDDLGSTAIEIHVIGSGGGGKESGGETIELLVIPNCMRKSRRNVELGNMWGGKASAGTVSEK